MHAVIVERGHAAHSVIDVVAVDTYKQHHHSRDSCPDNLQWQIALDGGAVAGFASAASEANQAVEDQPHDPDKQDRANAE